MSFFSKLKALFSKKTTHKVAKAASNVRIHSAATTLKVVPNTKGQNSAMKTQHQKVEIAQYQQKIQQMLQNDPQAQKRAAQIISGMINSQTKNKAA